MRRPLIKTQKIAILLGVLGFLIGSWFLYDAWEGRGIRTPPIARPFTWW